MLVLCIALEEMCTESLMTYCGCDEIEICDNVPKVHFAASFSSKQESRNMMRFVFPFAHVFKSCV